MCWRNSESPSDKAVDGQTIQPLAYSTIYTHTHTNDTHFTLDPLQRIYLSIPHVGLTVSPYQWREPGLHPFAPLPSVSSLSHSGIGSRFPCKPLRTMIHICRSHSSLFLSFSRFRRAMVALLMFFGVGNIYVCCSGDG